MLSVSSDPSSDFLVVTHSCIQHCNVLVSACCILLTTCSLTPLWRIVVKTPTFSVSVDTRFYSVASIVLCFRGRNLHHLWSSLPSTSGHVCVTDSSVLCSLHECTRVHRVIEILQKVFHLIKAADAVTKNAAVNVGNYRLIEMLEETFALIVFLFSLQDAWTAYAGQQIAGCETFHAMCTPLLGPSGGRR